MLSFFFFFFTCTHKAQKLNLYTQALLLLRRTPCWNKLSTAQHTHHARHVRLDSLDMSKVSSRDVTSQVEFGLIWAIIVIYTFRMKTQIMELACCTVSHCRGVCEYRAEWRGNQHSLSSVPNSPNSTWRVKPRHDTTRYLPMYFGRWKVVTCYVALVEQHGATRASRIARRARHARHDERHRHDLHDTCWGASPQRQCGLGWTCPPHFFRKLFLRLMQIQIKRLHASTTASSSAAMLEQALRDTHDTEDTS